MLEVKNLRVEYNGVRVVDLDEFQGKRGLIYAITGPNGSGKSTFLKCLAGLIPPVEGQVILDGRDITQTPSKHVGIVLQRPVLLSGSVADNIQYGLKCNGVPKAECGNLVDAIMNDLDLTHLARKNRRALSGGEIQRVALARSLVLKPDVLILDEPFSHLDQSSGEQLIEVIHAIQSRGNTIILLATHDYYKGCALADEVVTLSHGQRSKLAFTNILKGLSVERDNQHILELADGTQIVHTTPVLGPAPFYVDPSAIVLAEERHVTTARNQLKGTITGIIQENNRFRTTVDTGVVFTVFVTERSVREMMLQPGKHVWLTFKASSMRKIDLYNSSPVG